MAFAGKLRKDSMRYTIHDLEMDGYTLSRTVLHPYQQTKGHSHPHTEAYCFVQGKGTMQVGDEFLPVEAGDMVPVDKGEFHKVTNEEGAGMIFLCAWGQE